MLGEDGEGQAAQEGDFGVEGVGLAGWVGGWVEWVGGWKECKRVVVG